MILTSAQAERRLSSPDNLANRFSVREIPIRRPGNHSKHLSRAKRNEIAIRTRAGENQKEVAEDFDVTVDAVSKIETGKVKGIDEDQVKVAIEDVKDKALQRLMSSLGLLSDDKLSGCSAKDLSSIAANMSKIVEKTMPREQSNSATNIIIYTPELRNENSFKVVEI